MMGMRWLGALSVWIVAALISFGVAATPASAGSTVPNRATLQTLIGGIGTLESFEAYNVPNGGAEGLITPTVTSTTVVNGQGPGLVVPGIILSCSSGQQQWNGNGYFSLSTRTYLGYPANTLVVDFAPAVGAFGVDLTAFNGFAYTAEVKVFATDDTTVLFTQTLAVPNAPSKIFFGYQEAAGIGKVELRDQIHAWTAIIDDLEFGLQTCGNGTIDAGEQCDDGNVADGDCCSSTCQYEPNGAPCTSDGLPCSTDVCNATGTCTHNASLSGTPCRASAGVCDVAETCDGSSTSCPADGFANSGECRAAADVCDAAESCDGSGPNCPADGYLSSGECRASAGVCDLAESCDGSGIACPADAKSTDPCRAVADVCDVAESCDGINDDCPADGFALVGTPCRADAGQCDVAEACTGLSAACPADAKEPNDTPCNDNDACTQTDTCQGGTCIGADPLDCDDEDACTADSCDPMGGCVNDDAPATGCLTAGKSLVLIKDSTDDGKDKLLWKWIKGAAFTQMDLGDPTSNASYALCVYAGTANALIADAALPPGPSWSAIGDKGYKFKGTSPDGLSLALLKGGAAGKSKALAKGKGAALPDPTLPVAYPVTVQLKKDGSPLCLESTFTSANEKKNTDTQFKAKK